MTNKPTDEVRRVFGETEARVCWITAEQELLEAYVDDYEMCCEDGYYTPTEQERELIRDALQGFVVEHDKLLDKHLAMVASTPQEPDDDALPAFVRESNRIEGIKETTDAHVMAHRKFLDGPVHIPALVELVSVLQPDARFRNAVNIPGVRVGNHIAPPSGPDIEGNLRSILAMRDPWEQHIAYETLHPFTDGNGRSGRAVWLHRFWHEEALDAWAVRRGFLHSFYYHTLSGVRLQAPDPPYSGIVDEADFTRGEE